MKTILLLVCLLGLTACAARGQIEGKPGNATVDSPGDHTTDTAPFLVYTRSGGFAGITESWEIYPDGRMVSREGEVKQAGAEAAAALFEDLREADLARLSQNEPGPGNCADCFTIELVVNDGEQRSTITVVPESSQADPEAVQIVEIVQEFIDAAP